MYTVATSYEDVVMWGRVADRVGAHRARARAFAWQEPGGRGASREATSPFEERQPTTRGASVDTLVPIVVEDVGIGA